MSIDKIAGSAITHVAMERVQSVPRTQPAPPVDRQRLEEPEPERQLEALAHRIETYLKSVGRALEFRVDVGSGQTVVSVRDAETGELIRQIPNEEILRLAQMAEDQTIVLMSETA